MQLGANTWIWVSPLTDERLTQLAPRVRDMGFDVVELPVENLGDWSPEHAAEVLAEHGHEIEGAGLRACRVRHIRPSLSTR